MIGGCGSRSPASGASGASGVSGVGGVGGALSRGDPLRESSNRAEPGQNRPEPVPKQGKGARKSPII